MQISICYVGTPKIARKAQEFNREANRYVAVLGAGALSTDIARASQPIKELLTGLADPICYIVFAWGILECMLGKAGSGVNRMKYATLGFMAMNWIPTFMNILRGATP